jgi:hypothetical protein
MRPPLDLLARRIIVIALITWTPLLVLSAIAGRIWGGARVPFLYDIEVHVRFLISLPLLIFAEVFVHQRIQPIIKEFLDRGIITPEVRPSFQAIIDSSRRWRNSVIAEVVLIVLGLTAGLMLWRGRIALRTSIWYANPSASGMHLTLPGIYYAYFSMTVYRFILFRWYYRLIIWFVFLKRVARLPLKLFPVHPDGAGGLEFLQGGAYAVTPVLVAQTILLAGVLANRIFYQGAIFYAFRGEILAILLFFMFLALGPLMVFAPRIMECRRKGLIEYGKLGSDYVREFERKWIVGQKDPNEPLLGNRDLPPLAGLANSFEIVRSMNGLPFGKEAVIRLVLMILLPLSPLMLTVMPLNDVIDRLFKAILV